MTDAWKAVADLWRQHSKRWEVRHDLTVDALGPNRNVRIGIGTGRPHPKFSNGPDDPLMEEFTYTTRNIGTMREFADCIHAACDAVEESNPDWASDLDSHDPPDVFLK